LKTPTVSVQLTSKDERLSITQQFNSFK